MGHRLLPRLPDTAPWRRVVRLLADDASVARVADATTQAAQRGLQIARDDAGLVHVVWLLSKVAIAARSDDFGAALNEVGVQSPAHLGLYDLVGGFSEAVDRHLQETGGRTDISEIAQLSAVECLTRMVRQRSTSLLETAPDDIQRAVYRLSTKNGFAALAYDFFSRFTHRFLTYHLGRELSNHVGPNGRFSDPAANDDFVAELRTHCQEAALIMKRYAGGWYSKAHFEDGISPTRARNFTRYALQKLRDELKLRGAKDAQ